MFMTSQIRETAEMFTKHKLIKILILIIQDFLLSFVHGWLKTEISVSYERKHPTKPHVISNTLSNIILLILFSLLFL